MKYILILCLLLCSTSANAGWFSSDPPLLQVAAERIMQLEDQLSAQASLVNLWQIATGTLGVACVILFVIGTALGAKTRTHYDGTRRLGRSSTSTPAVNGRKPNIMGKESEAGVHTTLAA